MHEWGGEGAPPKRGPGRRERHLNVCLPDSSTRLQPSRASPIISSQILFFTQLIPELFLDPISCRFIFKLPLSWRPANKSGRSQMPFSSPVIVHDGNHYATKKGGGVLRARVHPDTAPPPTIPNIASKRRHGRKPDFTTESQECVLLCVIVNQGSV